jgi:glycosyltransferase involved in cell wall biosynthesis
MRLQLRAVGDPVAMQRVADRGRGVRSATPTVTRLAVLNSHPIQYFAPLYAYLNTAPDLKVTALYLSDVSIRGGKDAEFGRDVRWDIDLLAGYDSVFLGEAAQIREPAGFWSLIAPQVWREVRSGRYDALWLHGHNYAANLIALLAAKSAGLPVMMRGDTQLGVPSRSAKAGLRRPLMGALYALCNGLLAVGSENAAYYRAMGVPIQKIFLVPYTVDNERFIRATALTEDERRQIRLKYQVPVDRPAVLYAAKLTRRKRPGDLLEAARQLNSDKGSPFSVIMAGSGELEHELRAFCSQHGLTNIVFTGFINQSELPGLYAASDIFVLPSQDEPWGLAVNEAMCAGLPVVVSREVGCVPDLVQEGVNGFTPAAGDVDALACALGRLIADKDFRRRQGEASLARIRQWSHRECLDGIRAAVRSFKMPNAQGLGSSAAGERHNLLDQSTLNQ